MNHYIVQMEVACGVQERRSDAPTVFAAVLRVACELHAEGAAATDLGRFFAINLDDEFDRLGEPL